MLIEKNVMSKPQISSPENDNLSRNSKEVELPKFELIAVESIVPGTDDNIISPRRSQEVGIGLIKSDITKPENSFLQQLEKVKKEESECQHEIGAESSIN